MTAYTYDPFGPGKDWQKNGHSLTRKIPHIPEKLQPKMDFWEPDNCINVDFGNLPEGEHIAYTKEVYDGIAINFRKDGVPCGIELYALTRDPEPELPEEGESHVSG